MFRIQAVKRLKPNRHFVRHVRKEVRRHLLQSRVEDEIHLYVG